LIRGKDGGSLVIVMKNLIESLKQIGHEAVIVDGGGLLVKQKDGLAVCLPAGDITFDEASRLLSRMGIKVKGLEDVKHEPVIQPAKISEPEPVTVSHSTLEIKELGRGWFDVVNTETGKPINEKRLREADAKALHDAEKANT
jgi:hypothetical protein